VIWQVNKVKVSLSRDDKWGYPESPNMDKIKQNNRGN
jgi:hypothetical protein